MTLSGFSIVPWLKQNHALCWMVMGTYASAKNKKIQPYAQRAPWGWRGRVCPTDQWEWRASTASPAEQTMGLSQGFSREGSGPAWHRLCGKHRARSSEEHGGFLLRTRLVWCRSRRADQWGSKRTSPEMGPRAKIIPSLAKTASHVSGHRVTQSITSLGTTD